MDYTPERNHPDDHAEGGAECAPTCALATLRMR